MMFTSLMSGIIAASIAIPALLLLYFLKLKRQQRTVPSTLLWKRAVQDLQVNAPFQKLRKNLLLFLQMLILIALLFAIAGPVANFKKLSGKNVVILIDRSGSMKTVESDNRTRLEHAKEAASAYLSAMPSGSKAMVVAFADRAEVVCTFSEEIGRLQARIDEIEATDARSQIGEALQLAVAYSTKTSVSADVEPGEQIAPAEMAELELFSDGRLLDAEKEFVTRGKLTFHRIGEAEDNVGIVAFDLRRDIERPGVVAVFAQVENFGPKAVTTDVSLSIDGGLPKVQEVTLGAAIDSASQPAAPRGTSDLAPAQNLIFELVSPSGGLIEIKVHRPDALDIDNVVVAPMEPPRAIRILSVSGRPEIQDRVRWTFQYALEIDDFTAMTPAEYESAAESELTVDGRSAFDLVLLDKHDTDKLPPGNYVFFGGIPKIDSVEREPEDIDEQVFVNWRDSHPLLRHVPLQKVVALKWSRLKLPSHAVKLIEGENSTVMAFITDPGHRYVIFAFDLMESNFYKELSLIMFSMNAVSYLAAGGLTESGRLIHPGETIAMQVPPGATKAEVKSPDSRIAEIDTAQRQNATFARTEKRGLYRAVFNDEAKSTETFAANVLDATESFIRPAKELRMGSGDVAGVTEEIKVNQPLWPYAVAVALGILVFEWWVYNKRVMI